ncbi:MAG: B12-binding domain-containing radical SAM protein [Desulfobacterales bacterium]|nr:B12-binding domain-containing radical SAM protein [Desulfobacterales bacterium]
MKVVGYYPPVTLETSFPTWEPLQFVYLHRMLRVENISFALIDGRIWKQDERKEKIKQLLDNETLCFAVTSLTCYQIMDAIETAKYVKSIRPDIQIIIGGWHASIFAEETLSLNEVDIVVRGQGEVTFIELIKRLSQHKSVEGILGCSWKCDSKHIHEANRPITHPDELPKLLPEDFDILELNHYQIHNILFYMSSVGCPYACHYCCIGAQSKQKWIGLSAPKVLDELIELHHRFHFKEVIFWDNVFFSNKKRVQDICKGLIESNVHISWSAHGRINEIAEWEDDFFSLLKQSGCSTLFLGVESGSQHVLDCIGKKIKAADILPVFRKLKTFGFNVAVNYMVGLPGETHADIKKTMTAIKNGLTVFNYDLCLFNVYVYRFVPFPGTHLFSELPKLKRLDYPTGSIEWGEYIHKTVKEGMAPWEEQNDTSLYASSTFYLWKAYLNRETPKTLLGKLLKQISKLRVNTGFYRVPIEWLIWKIKRSTKIKNQKSKI